MRLHRFLAALLLGLPMATPIPVAAENAPLAPEVQRRVAVVVLARRIRGYAAMANPLVVAVSPSLQRLLDGSCAWIQPRRLKRCGWPKTSSEPFLDLGLRRGQ